jgi:hypothetical protein
VALVVAAARVVPAALEQELQTKVTLVAAALPVFHGLVAVAVVLVVALRLMERIQRAVPEALVFCPQLAALP